MSFLDAVYVKDELVVVDYYCHMVPFGSVGQGAAYIQTVTRTIIPSYRNRIVGVAVEKESAPSRANLMAVVYVACAAHEELYGSLAQGAGDCVGDCDSTLVEHGQFVCRVVGCLYCNLVRGCRLLFVCSCLIYGLHAEGAFGAIVERKGCLLGG